MAYNIVRFELDPTGKNPNNKVIDEPHSVQASNKIRSIAPTYGPFFAESLIVKEDGNILTRGVDYQIVELHQEATLKFGKEISSVILIINNQLGPNFTITYQVLGGHYTYDDSTIANLYQSVISDNRPVDWTNVTNKPTEFPPTLHRHLLDDLYGFEPIVDYLERIKRAITLGQADILMDVIKQLFATFRFKELPKVIPYNRILTYDAFLHFITYKKLINDINIRFTEPVYFKGDVLIAEIDSSDVPVGSIYYWQLYSQGKTTFDLFKLPHGEFITTGSKQTIHVYIPTIEIFNDYPLYIGIKKSLDDEEFIATSYIGVIASKYRKGGIIYPYILINGYETETSDMLLYDCENDDLVRAWYLLTNAY